MKNIAVLVLILLAGLTVSPVFAFNVVEKVGEAVVCSYTVATMDEVRNVPSRRVFVDGVEIIQYNEQAVCGALFATYFQAHPDHLQFMPIIQPCLRFGNAESFGVLKAYMDMLVTSEAVTTAELAEFQTILSTVGGVDLEDYAV